MEPSRKRSRTKSSRKRKRSTKKRTKKSQTKSEKSRKTSQKTGRRKKRRPSSKSVDATLDNLKSVGTSDYPKYILRIKNKSKDKITSVELKKVREYIKKKTKPKSRSTKKKRKSRFKRALTPYNAYIKTNFEKVKKSIQKERGGDKVSSTDVIKELAATWKEETNRGRYESMANVDKQRSKKERAAYDKRLKQPLNSFLLFSKDHREQVKKSGDNPSVKEVSRLLGQKWKYLSQDKKDGYKRKAAELRKQYKRKRDKRNSLTQTD